MKKNFPLALLVLFIALAITRCQRTDLKPGTDALPSGTTAEQALGRKAKTYDEYFAVSNIVSHSVSFIDASSKTVTNTLTIPGSIPYYFVYLPIRDRLYLTDAGNGAVQVIDPATQTVEESIPVGAGTIMHMVGHERKNRLWVVNNTAKTVTEINANNDNIVYTLQLSNTPHDIAVNANGTKMYVSVNMGGTWAINTYSTDLETGSGYALIDSRPFGNNWLHLYFSRVNNKLYAADQGLGKFWALDPNNLNATAPSVSIPGAHGLTLSDDEAYSYIASITENKIYVYNNATNTIESSITSTINPNIHNLAVNRSNDLLFGTHSGASSTNSSYYTITNAALSGGTPVTVGTNPQAVTWYQRRIKTN